MPIAIHHIYPPKSTYTPCITNSPALSSSKSSASSFDYIFFPSRCSIDQKGAALAATLQERAFGFFFYIFLVSWIFERRYPHIESIFCGRSTSQTRGKGGPV